jgi:hypothetical protein
LMCVGPVWRKRNGSFFENKMNPNNPKDRKPLKALPTITEFRQKRIDYINDIRKEKRNELLSARRKQLMESHLDPLGERHLGMSNDHWQAFAEKTRQENRASLAGSQQEVRHRPELSNFIYDTGATTVAHQVKYGPSANIKKSDQEWLKNNFGDNVNKRYSQYSSKHDTYVSGAHSVGQPLTLQEDAVENGNDPGKTSINHVIASGTGQNLLNHMALQHARGKEEMATALQNNNPRGVMAGLAKQAAAEGRMRGIGRGLLAEEAPQSGYGTRVDGMLGDLDTHTAKRNLMARDIHNAFDAPKTEQRLESYKSYMKNTFDSVGNLRLGHGTGNGRVSTGFDMPLTDTLEPTAHGRRLYEVQQNYGLSEMETPATVHLEDKSFRSGLFTTNQHGQKLSSSIEKK